MASSSPLRVLVAGGGTAAVEAVLALHALAGDRVRIELLAPGGALAQRPASVLTPFSGAHAPAVSLNRLDALGVIRHGGTLASVDAARHRVTTSGGGELEYDRLIVATGARMVDGVPGAVTFRGPVSAGAVEHALREATSQVLFVLPGGMAWALPLYELALLAANELADGPALGIISPEPRPLDLFGRTASDAVARLLDRAGVDFTGDTQAEAVIEDALVLSGGQLLAADAVIALPRLQGPQLPGLPADAAGFVAIDEHARVCGLADVYAAGDITAGAVKQGGLAAQQADAAAEAIAAEAGADLTPAPYRPILRGLLLTGETPLYLRTDLSSGEADAQAIGVTRDSVSRFPLWWPPTKVAGRYLAAFLASGGARDEALADRGARPEPAAVVELSAALARDDASRGDFRAAVHVLDAAALWLEGGLPESLAAQRAEWMALVDQ